MDQQQTTLKGVPPPVNSTSESSFVFATLAPFDGATEVEAADDLGCALVSLNTAMNKMGYEPFSLEEVHRASVNSRGWVIYRWQIFYGPMVNNVRN